MLDLLRGIARTTSMLGDQDAPAGQHHPTDVMYGVLNAILTPVAKETGEGAVVT